MSDVIQHFDVPYRYPVAFTRDVFAVGNETLRGVLVPGASGPRRVLPAIDSGVLEANPDLVDAMREYFRAHSDVAELVERPLVVRGGEICKSDPREVEELHQLIARHRMCRHSTVLAVGGGAVLDAMGFATAIAHRGLRLVRLPTTVLAQNDAGIGVKNAINFGGRKNFLGTFAPPTAVVNDFDFLRTLPARDLRAGIAEAVKVALIKDGAFFETMYTDRRILAAFVPKPMEQMIRRCAELHLEHIRSSGDPFEQGNARPLDFGHWAAHKLEELASGDLRHGEAVAIGIAIDSLYSHRRGRLPEAGLARILTILEDLGFDLHHPVLASLDVTKALEEFREHLGDELCITLLDDIGRGVEVHEIDRAAVRKCIDYLLGR